MDEYGGKRMGGWLGRHLEDWLLMDFSICSCFRFVFALEKSGANIIGTSPDSIDLAEDRERFQKMIQKLKLKQPVNDTARSQDEAVEIANSIGFPLVVRPSYVLGGRAMEIVYDNESLERYMKTAVKVSNDSPVLLDSFLDHAIEVDIDVISDG